MSADSRGGRRVAASLRDTAIMEALVDGPKSSRELAQRFGLSTPYLLKRLALLFEDGQVKQIGSGARTRWALVSWDAPVVVPAPRPLVVRVRPPAEQPPQAEAPDSWWLNKSREELRDAIRTNQDRMHRSRFAAPIRLTN